MRNTKFGISPLEKDEQPARRLVADPATRPHSTGERHVPGVDLDFRRRRGWAVRPNATRRSRRERANGPPASHEVALWGFADVCTHALVCATHLKAHTSLKQTGIHMCQSVLVVAPLHAHPEGGVSHHDERRNSVLPQPLAPLEVGSKFSETTSSQNSGVHKVVVLTPNVIGFPPTGFRRSLGPPQYCSRR